MEVEDSDESKTNTISEPLFVSKEEKIYQLDESWTQDIEDQWNPESFIKEYPKLKKLLQTFDVDPINYTIEVTKMLNKYQEKPELLDPHLQEICDLIMRHIKPNLSERDESKINNPDNIINCALKLVYTLSIVRGYKTIVRYLPHEVTDLEPTLLYLLAIDQKKSSLWYSRYVLCIWLSIIVRVPFNLNTIDSFGDMIFKIISMVKSYLDRSEKSREGAAVLISRLFSRPDFEQTHMVQFFDWCLDKLKTLKEQQNIFLFTGIFRALAEIFKHAHRDALLPHAPMILECSGKLWTTNKSRIVRKYASKLIQRIGLVFLKPVIAPWRYTKSRHVLMAKQSENANENDKTSGVTTKDDAKDSNDGGFAVPDQIEYILDILLNSLRDKETVVRWSAAKGIGRITMRLPKIFGDEIVTNVLELLSPTEGHESWHGGCLCLAELSRRGLLLPQRIGAVMQRISKAMLYDVFQGQSSVGDAVRDSACYVCWAFARAYDPSLMQPHVSTLSKSLLTMAVFDKEIHCRRAACAAFQENVGRLGNFKHGIEINTAADYWSVGLLSNAYLKVSKKIAKFDEYRTHLIDHLVNDKLSYWDLKIRTLASKALHNMTELDPEYMQNSVLPILINRCQSQSVFERHGALCGIAQIINALNAQQITISDQLQKHIKMIIPKLEKNRGYRGRGGERVREQCCRVLEAFCNAKFKITEKGINRYQESIDENLRIPQEFVQNAAVDALKALSTNYEIGSDKYLNKWCTELNKEIIASVTRGYSRALGVLNKKLLLPHLKQVIDTLIRKSLIMQNEDFRDYETRKFCCIALADLVETIGCSEDYEYEWNENEDNDQKNDNSDEDTEEMKQLKALGIDLDVTKEKHERSAHQKKITNELFSFAFDVNDKSQSSLLYDRILSALLLRFEDYEVDRRGDVGSFVREHNLMQIFRVMIVLAKASSKEKKWLRDGVATLILNHVLRQLSEKLDRVRRAAGHVIELIFDSDDSDMQRIQFEDDAQIRSIFAGHKGIDWSAPAVVFPLLVKALDLESYRRSIVEGLLQSVGCINSTMSRLTIETLEPYMNGLADNNMKNQLIAIGNDFIYCLKKRHLNRLFMIPFLKGIGKILAEKCYFEPLQNEKKCKFAINLFAQLKKECYKSTDILKLLTSIKVFIGLALFDATRERALQRMMVFLGYQYPALRKQTCLELSSAIAAFGDKIIKGEEKQNIAFDYLSTNVWGGTDLDAVRTQRNELFAMFDIKPPKLKTLKKLKQQNKKDNDAT